VPSVRLYLARGVVVAVPTGVPPGAPVVASFSLSRWEADPLPNAQTYLVRSFVLYIY